MTQCYLVWKCENQGSLRDFNKWDGTEYYMPYNLLKIFSLHDVHLGFGSRTITFSRGDGGMERGPL